MPLLGTHSPTTCLGMRQRQGPLVGGGGTWQQRRYSGNSPTWQQQQEMADEVNFAMPVDGEGEDVEQSPTVGVGGPLDATTEDANNLETPDSGGDVNTRSITNPCDDPTAVLENVANPRRQKFLGQHVSLSTSQGLYHCYSHIIMHQAILGAVTDIV